MPLHKKEIEIFQLCFACWLYSSVGAASEYQWVHKQLFILNFLSGLVVVVSVKQSLGHPKDLVS